MNTQTLRVQPVKPEQEPLADLVGDLVASLVFAFLNGLFIMLAANALHGYYPAVAPLGYWDAWFVALGIGALSGLLQRPFKWARR